MHSSLLRDISESDAFSPLRLHLLATLLSLSPSRLLLYVAAAHGPRLVSEPSREFSPLMHAILLALMLPFSTPDAIAEQSAAASPQQQQSRKGTSRDSTAERPSLLEPHEHFESMRSVVVPSRASSEESHGSCIYNDSSSSNCWSESPSLRSYSADEAPEPEHAEPKKHKKTEKKHVSLRREFSPERSATQLLRDLAEPLLHARSAVAHSIGRRIGSSSSSRKAFVMASRSEGQQSMQLLPRELHSAAGVARLTNLCPPFVPLLLEALLKESVRSDVFGLAARYSFLRLIELSAPLFIAPHSAVLARATQRLVTAAVAALNVLEDSNWALEFIGALIAVHLVHPSALRAQLERRAADLAKAPTNWRPFVALAYCAVTEQSLGLSLSAAVAEREGTAAIQMVTLLDEAAKTDGDDNENENNNNDDDGGGGGGVEEEEPQQSQDAVRGLSEAHVSVADTSLADVSVSFSGSPPFLSPFGRAASPSLPAEISADMAAVPQWTFPARLPPAVTLPAVTVMTCMVLCKRNVSKRAAVAIGLWCLRAIVELPATPCAVALTHLMLKYPAYFTDVTVRGRSGSGLGMGRGGEASQTTFAQTQLPMVQSWTAAASTSIRFWDAAAIEACRPAEAALRRYARQRADERLAAETKPSASNNKEVEEEKHENHEEEEEEGRGEVPEQKPDDAVLDDLHDAQCYLMLLLEVVALRRGVLFSSAAQDALASLFACAARLRIAAGPFLSSPPRSALQSRAVVLCDEAFRAVARAVDIVLHDYAAGYPRQLCDALAAIGPHSNSNSNISVGNVSGPFAAGLRRAGAWDRHADCLETIAAAAAYAASGARRVGDFADTTAAQEPAAAKGRAAVEPAPAPRSLVGELPCSGEPLRLGAQDSGGGGLAAAQRQWWARRTVTFLVEQWWRAHGVAVVRCRPDTDGKSYLECCPHAI